LTEGQKSAPALAYAPLPAAIVAKEQAQLKTLEAPAAAPAKKGK